MVHHVVEVFTLLEEPKPLSEGEFTATSFVSNVRESESVVDTYMMSKAYIWRYLSNSQTFPVWAKRSLTRFMKTPDVESIMGSNSLIVVMAYAFEIARLSLECLSSSMTAEMFSTKTPSLLYCAWQS